MNELQEDHVTEKTRKIIISKFMCESRKAEIPCTTNGCGTKNREIKICTVNDNEHEF